VGPFLLLRCVRRCPTLPHSLPCSTIGAGGLNFRVRDGTGCFPSAKTTETYHSTTRFAGAEIFGSGASTATYSLVTAPPAAPCRGGRLFSGNRTGTRTYTAVINHVVCVEVTRPISTGQLHTLRCFHFRPINPVVCWGPYPPHGGGRSHLEEGFPLRCFQRLSRPNVANQPCHWHDNWHTRGSSVPVLSY
jgi:hypothetical protein